MKNYIIAFVLFILFVFILAISIGRGDDDISYEEPIEKPEPAEQLVEKPSSEAEIENKTVDLADNQSEEQTEVQTEDATDLPVNKAGHPEQIIKRIAYTVSFNSTTKCPNWVAWKLTKDHTDGPYSRKGVPYYEEDGTASGIGVVTNENLKNIYFLDTEIKGPRQEFRDWYDKSYHVNHGHMMPAADNRWSKAAMNQSFYLSNMCPQDIDLNGGDWESIEKACRKWAIKHSEIYIVSGPIFNSQKYRTMGEGKVAIPDAFFKVVLRLGKVPGAIGFICPNEGTHHDQDYYIRTVDEIENLIGFDFFSSLPDEIETRIESSSDLKDW
jgi:endonuclease G